MEKENGGPAYPYGVRVTRMNYRGEEFEVDANEAGMTLRDYFAGQALCGMLNSKALAHLNHDVQAATAYEYADAMIAARSK